MISSTHVAAALVLVYAIYRLARIGKREGYLPPGPPTVPILGNAHIFPKTWAYLQLSTFQFHSARLDTDFNLGSRHGPASGATVTA